MTEAEYESLKLRMLQMGQIQSETSEAALNPPWVGKLKPVPVEGPLRVVLTLHGHCPSKKNLWQRGTAGKMFLSADVRAQIDVLTTQALFGWGQTGPVEHPDLTVRFFVCGARQDQDGMYTTVLDCLQAAGVIVNDNIAHCNGRKVLEPCEVVSDADERVEIVVEKRNEK